MSRRRSVEEMKRNQVKNFSGEKFFTVKNALKYLKLIKRYAGKELFKLQSLLRKVLKHKSCKSKVQRRQLYCVQHKLDIVGCAIEMHLLSF